jgi:omega-amidase
MRIAVFQFQESYDITENHKAIIRAIVSASEKKVRLLVFQECAACGYPTIESSHIRNIEFEGLASNLKEIQEYAEKYGMYIALGTIRKDGLSHYNTIQLINPKGELVGTYDKRALWGWDLDNFQPGKDLGVFEIDDIKVGFRICFEIRFPEYFRELFKAKAELCFVSFSDTSDQDSLQRYELIKSHLATRAVENVMTVVSVNSCAQYQTAPTAVFDINGVVVQEAPRNQEYLLFYDYCSPEIGFSTRGRLENSNRLLGLG